MSSLRHKLEYPLHMFDNAEGHRSGYKIGGALFLLLTILGIIWLFPEIRRYIRIERM